jgi:hypothetical protein
MKTNKYEISVVHTQDKDGRDVGKRLKFDIETMGDIFETVEKMKVKFCLSDETATSAFVGLKLFGETLMANADEPFFKEVKPHFAQIRKIVLGKDGE